MSHGGLPAAALAAKGWLVMVMVILACRTPWGKTRFSPRGKNPPGGKPGGIDFPWVFPRGNTDFKPRVSPGVSRGWLDGGETVFRFSPV